MPSTSHYKRFQSRPAPDLRSPYRTQRHPSCTHQPALPYKLNHRPRPREYESYDCLYERAAPTRCKSMFTHHPEKFSLASSYEPCMSYTCNGRTPDFVPLTHRLETSNHRSSPRFSLLEKFPEIKPVPQVRNVRRVDLCHKSREDMPPQRHHRYFSSSRPSFDPVPRAKTRHHTHNRYNTQHNNKLPENRLQRISQRLEESLCKFHDRMTNDHYKTFPTWPDAPSLAVSSCHSQPRSPIPSLVSCTDIQCLDNECEGGKKERLLKQSKMEGYKKKWAHDDSSARNITYKNRSCNHKRDSDNTFVIPKKQKLLLPSSSESTLGKPNSDCENQETKNEKKSEKKKKKKKLKENPTEIEDQAQTVLELQERINYLQTKQAVLNNNHSCWENLINGSVYTNCYTNPNITFNPQSHGMLPEMPDLFNISEFSTYGMMPPNMPF